MRRTNDAHRVVLRRVFPKTAGIQLDDGAVEIIGAQGKMAIVIVDVADPEGARRIDSQMHLQVAAGEPAAGYLERRPLNGREAEHLLIERERPREIGDDDRNMVERKLSHRRR